MRKTHEILRLHHEQGLRPRPIAARAGVALSTVQECLKRAVAAGLGWPLPLELDEAALEARLYPPPAPRQDTWCCRILPLHIELTRLGVTRFLLWTEYQAAHPEGLQYTAFCNHYRHWLARPDVVLRQAHASGEKLFVDYAGQTVPVGEPAYR
ncbi:MAG: IS21 family transposase [Gammaproteobacteria bacterium]